MSAGVFRMLCKAIIVRLLSYRDSGSAVGGIVGLKCGWGVVLYMDEGGVAT